MRYSEVIYESRPTLADYTSLGLDVDTAGRYLAARIPPASAKAYQRHIDNREADFAEVLGWHKDHLRRQKEQRDYDKLVASLPRLAAATTPLTHDAACAVIANDDDLFDAVALSVSNPDWFEDHPDITKRLRAVIDRIKPFKHSPLYRGECLNRFSEHTRGFHSWSLNRQTADYFYTDCGRYGGQLMLLTVPIKAVELGRVGTWRMRLRPESHYLGSQSEWLVPDGYPCKIIANT